MKKDAAIYLDTSVISVYVLPRHLSYLSVRDLIESAEAQGVELVSLPLIKKEAARGGSKAKPRVGAIRAHVDFLQWTPAVKKATARILLECPLKERVDREADIQHYAAASVYGVPYLVMLDGDFLHIQRELAPSDMFKPKVLFPGEMLELLRSGEAFRHRANPTRRSRKPVFPLALKAHLKRVREAKRAYGRAVLHGEPLAQKHAKLLAW